jgi:hypothetical protein
MPQAPVQRRCHVAACGDERDHQHAPAVDGAVIHAVIGLAPAAPALPVGLADELRQPEQWHQQALEAVAIAVMSNGSSATPLTRPGSKRVNNGGSKACGSPSRVVLARAIMC